ncbi:hypothetical protein PG997_007453 [Apiospora hydei]|uniref:Ketoreductase (KR) domain-containing protein n=1 Tax=Apiospora hydei TaxID=1337664 RepID=A0ABR1W816_9PEZI
MSLCRAVIRRLPVCRPASIGAASFCGTRPNRTFINRLFHTAPLANRKQTNPETSEQEKVRHSEPSPVGRENIGAKRFADFDLAGKVFVVTGGAQGLGLALAEALVEAGGKGQYAHSSHRFNQCSKDKRTKQVTAIIAVYCVDRSPEPDEQWRQAQERVVPEWGGSLHYRQQDVSDTAHLDQLMQAIADESGRLDGLAETSEFKGAVLFLSSKASSFMTGGNLLIDGGHTQW